MFYGDSTLPVDQKQMSISNIYFATNRNYEPDEGGPKFGDQFSADGPYNLRFGQATIDFADPATPIIANIDVEADMPVAAEATGVAASAYGSLAQFEKLKTSMLNGSETIVYVHGFNTSFESSLRDAARIKRYYGSQGINREVLVFTWPSFGNLLKYLPDRAHAKTSGLALARFILKGADYLKSIPRNTACRQPLHLIAHSMGVYVLREAVQAATKEVQGAFPKIISQAILVAGDEDDDTFDLDYKMSRFPEMAERISIYFNRRDSALTVSDRVKFNPTRLGQSGPAFPKNPRAGVYSIDATACAALPNMPEPGLKDLILDELVQHSYYLYNRGMIRDINSVLSGAEQIDIKENRKYDQAQGRIILLPSTS